MLDSDLAELYGVETKVLMQAVEEIRPLPQGLYVSDCATGHKLEVTICDLDSMADAEIVSRIHRTGRCHAVKRAQVSAPCR